MPITMVARNGPPDAMTCPAIICDACGAPINPNGGYGGLVLWHTDHKENERHTTTDVSYVHKGLCDRRWSAGKEHFLSRELGDFMAQLAHNYEHPFIEEDNVEYLAPAPSRWRLGQYRRRT